MVTYTQVVEASVTANTVLQSFSGLLPSPNPPPPIPHHLDNQTTRSNITPMLKEKLNFLKRSNADLKWISSWKAYQCFPALQVFTGVSIGSFGYSCCPDCLEMNLISVWGHFIELPTRIRDFVRCALLYSDWFRNWTTPPFQPIRRKTETTRDSVFSRLEVFKMHWLWVLFGSLRHFLCSDWALRLL